MFCHCSEQDPNNKFQKGFDMAEIIETRRLNKFVKQNLITILSTPGVEVRFSGDDFTLKSLISEYHTGYGHIETVKPHTFFVNRYGQKVYEYKYSKDNISVCVGDNCVANVETPALNNPDIQELKDALVGKIIQEKKERLIEIDRKNMMYYEIRAMEELKQFQRS